MTTDAGAPPSIYLHAVDTYRLMMKRAQREKVSATESAMVYSGHMTKLIMGPPLNLPIPYYTQIRQILMGTGCAVQLKRGGGTSPSRWALYNEPTLDMYDRWMLTQEGSASKPTSETAQQGQMIRDLESRVSNLETAFEELVTAIGEG